MLSERANWTEAYARAYTVFAPCPVAPETRSSLQAANARVSERERKREKERQGLWEASAAEKDERKEGEEERVDYFTIMAAAMYRFATREVLGEEEKESTSFLLPLSGSLPDMTASSSSYRQLADCYQRKAETDCRAVLSIAASLHHRLEGGGRDEEESNGERKEKG